MRRILVGGLLFALLVATAWPPARVWAQQDDAGQQQKAAEFGRLWEGLQTERGPQDRIALAERALKLEAQLHEWPLTIGRAEARALLWWLLGSGYVELPHGDRSDNLERGLALHEQALRVLTRERSAIPWAALQNDLSIAYRNRVLGDLADNLEKAIAACEAALTVFTREALPREWANTQNNLAVAYADRIRGDRADNLEKAIAAYVAASTVTTREAFPRDWARLQNNLANAYAARIRGDRADNLERAITAYEAVLTVTTRDSLPYDWALTQNNLAIAYAERVRGDRADNLEKAIAAHEAALTARTREAQPHDWALTQNNLATAYQWRIRGDRADNLEKAIAAYEAALTVRTREGLPYDWALTQNNLAVAYADRVRGDRPDNLERAIAAFEAALKVRTRQALPHEWAATQINLGNAYTNHFRGDRADNLEKAIAAFEAALTVTTREALPRAWADTQNNLAIAYKSRILGDRADNLEKAISAYGQALTVFTREALPREWAQTQNNLAIAYQWRIRGDRADNLDRAITASEAALLVFTREALPSNHLRTGWLLGSLHLQAGKWRAAGTAYAGAREAFLLLFGQGLNDEEARHLIAQAGPLFAEAAYAAAQRGEGEQALTLASEGKARLLAVSLRLQGLGLPTDKRVRLDVLRQSIRDASRTYDAASGLERSSALDKLATLRTELLALVKEADSTQVKAAGGALAKAQRLVPDGGAIVVPIVTTVGGKFLIVTVARPGGGGAKASKQSVGAKVSDPKGLPPSLTIVDLPDLTSERLGMLMRGDGQVGASGGWLGAFKSESVGEWKSAIEGIGPELWHLLAGRLDAALEERGIKPGARIVWLPTSALGLLPIGLAQDPASATRLGEKYELVTAPSLEALSQAARQLESAPQPSLIAVVNPTGDLPFTEVEATLVAFHFAGRPRFTLDETSATPKAVLAGLKDKSYWHFASHGFFDWSDARKSGLKMRDEEPLTIGALLDAEGSLGRPRLVVLSACETGLYDVARNPDEFVGLPATFMQLGAAGVLATLWQVDDLATSLLLARFYDLHLGNGLAPPTALRGAQAWLRTASKEELRVYARAAAEAAKLDQSKLAELERGLANSRRTGSSRMAAMVRSLMPDAGTPVGQPATPDDTKGQPPFSHPYFWGGFVYTGL